MTALAVLIAILAVLSAGCGLARALPNFGEFILRESRARADLERAERGRR